LNVIEVCRHSFIGDWLSADSVVVDLGMNRGEFSRALSERFGCRIIGVEPVPDLYRTLPRLPRLSAEQRVVTADGGGAVLHLNPRTCATIDPQLAEPGTATVTVPGITVSELLERHGVQRVALLKLDVEGAELGILQTLPSDVLATIDQLSVEFHDFIDRSQADAVAAAIRRLTDTGFVCFRFSLDNTDVLFVNRARLPFGPRQRLWIAARYKYPRGIARRVRRLIGAATD
jgi:FkbM family methyltransferase